MDLLFWVAVNTKSDIEQYQEYLEQQEEEVPPP